MINTVEAVGLPSGDVCDVRERFTAIQLLLSSYWRCVNVGSRVT